MLYKIHLERAFRNLRIDPFDYPVLGLKWQDSIFVDLGVPFGFATGAASCQSCTALVTWKLRQNKIWIMNYLDDFLGVSPLQKASSDFLSLKNLLSYLGLPINSKKLDSPAESITCLGIQVNAWIGTLTIPLQKLNDIKQLCKKWTHKHCAIVLHIHKCIQPTRLFLNRILSVLRQAPDRGYILLPRGFFKDIAWFNKFLDQFNGVVAMHGKDVSHHEIFVDASLKMVGGYFKGKVYAIEIPEPIQNIASIVHLEAVNKLVAFKLWAKYWKNSKVIIWCDNVAVVHAFTFHKIQDPWLMACVRNVWYFSALHNVQLQVKHIAGINNVYADILSRWHTYSYCNSTTVQYMKSCIWEETDPNMLYPSFEI